MTNRVNFMNQWISTHTNVNGYVEATNPINQGSHVIPVMVHIVRETAAPNPAEPYITEEQVESQINALNAYFNGAGVSNTNAQIQFCLVKNNAGNAGNWDPFEPGILRYNPNPLANNSTTVTSANALAAWTNTCPYDEVLNIWVVRSIDGYNSGVRGYSPLPIAPQANLLPGIQLDGVVITAAVFGSNNYSNPTQTFPLVPNYPPSPGDLMVRNQGKILAHEVGHYLNLFHTFQGNLITNQTCVGVGANCSTDADFICDTEPVLQPAFTYINGSPVPSTCSNTGPDDVGNFMYYSDDVVMDHFTQDQTNWMLAHLINFRPGLITVQNLNNWGLIGNGCVADGVFAAFDITGNHCLNTPLAFSPVVATPIPNLATSWSWNFGDGNTATGPTPTHTYSNVGTYTITCTATDANSTNTSTSTQVITITPCGLNPNYIHNAQWYYGQHIGINFTSGVPVFNNAALVNHTVFASEGAYSYADNAGNLVFYTDGINLWNANHNQVNLQAIFPLTPPLLEPNFTLPGFPTQPITSVYGIMAIPFPNHPNQYLLFSAPSFSDPLNEIKFAIVDLNQPNPSVSSTQILSSNGLKMSEGLTIIPHCNGRDYWLVAHSRRVLNQNQNFFFTYLVTEYGVSNNPIISQPFTLEADKYMSIKGSAGNNRVALAGHATDVNQTGELAIYDFNNTTGTVTNEVLINVPGAGFSGGCSFTNSVLSDFLYFIIDQNHVWSYDILNSNLIQITTPANLSTNYMQLGPDENIYLSMPTVNSISIQRISNPVLSPTFNDIPIFANSPMTGKNNSLPNFMDGIQPAFTPLSMNVVYTSCDEVELTVPACWDGYDYDIDWGDGSPNQQSTNLPTNLPHNYTSAGTYTITLSLLPPGQTTIPLNPIQVTQVINILDPNTPIAGDATPCLNNTLPYTYSIPQLLNATYTWNVPAANGTIVGANNSHIVNVDWIASGATSLSVTVTSGACTLTFNLAINVQANPVVTITNSGACAWPTTLTALPAGLSSYAWNGPISGNANTLLTSTPGTYIVTVTDAQGCQDFSSTVVVQPIYPTVSATASSTLICIPNSSILSATGLNAVSYNWMPGNLSGSPITVSPTATTTYTVTASSSAGCTATSTVTVNVTTTGIACCNPALAAQAGTNYYNNVSTSSIGIGFVNINTPILFDGTITVDQSFSITNCSNVRMGPNAEFVLANNTTLTMDGCIVSAACNQMWQGIKADASNEKVIISNNTTLRDMQYGVWISNGAEIDCQNSTFIDNNFGIRFENTPANYLTPTNKGLVLNNTFTSTGNPLMPPLNMQNKSSVGILTFKCAEVQIGELVIGSSNIFDNVFNGIFDIPAANLFQIMRSYNNIFRDITNDYSSSIYPEGTLLNAYYSTYKGSGIFASDIWGGNITPWRMIDVRSVEDGGGFFDCDKAVVTNNISAIGIQNIIQNCRGGFLFANAHGQAYHIEKNRILDVFTGVQILGDVTRANIVNHDAANGGEITLQPNGMTTGAGNTQEWPVGVDIRFTNSMHTGSVNIGHNNMYIPGIGGRAVALALTGEKVIANDNQINFTTTDASPYVGQNMPHLMGFLTFGSVGSHINCNTVNGLQNTAWGIRNSQGIMLYESPRMEVACNFVNFTHHGLIPFGNCATGSDRIRGNLFFNHMWGTLLAPSIWYNGNLDNIGLLQSYDNNNQFWGMYVSPGNYPFYRYWMGPAPSQANKVYTSQSFASGGNAVNAAYQIVLTPNPLNCSNTCENTETQLSLLDSLINISAALEVANDSLNLPYFPEVGEWLARRRLYADLDQDSVARNSNSTLLNFYTTTTTQTIHDLYEADQSLQLLADSTSYADTLLFAQRLADAYIQNQSISSIKSYELNDKWINELHLNMLEAGTDSLNASDLLQLETLAKSCPSIAGTAVYKARTLYARYEPALTYNDFVICGSSSSFKNGNPFDSLLSFINQTTSEYPDTSKLVGGVILDDELRLYPNPADNELKLQYRFQDSKSRIFQLHDILGRKIVEQELSPLNRELSINTSSLQVGVYTYVVVQTSGHKITGKITIAR